jgi:hypothetical protein
MRPIFQVINHYIDRAIFYTDRVIFAPERFRYDHIKKYLDKTNEPILKYHLAEELLPFGNILTYEARQAVNAEYKAAQLQQAAFVKEFRGLGGKMKYDTLDSIFDFTDYLCKSLKYPYIRSIELVEKEFDYFYGYYRMPNKTIYVHLPFEIELICHEFAHHMVHMDGIFDANDIHGKNFLAAEKRVFQFLLEAHKKKKVGDT